MQKRSFKIKQFTLIKIIATFFNRFKRLTTFLIRIMKRVKRVYASLHLCPKPIAIAKITDKRWQIFFNHPRHNKLHDFDRRVYS